MENCIEIQSVDEIIAQYAQERIIVYCKKSHKRIIYLRKEGIEPMLKKATAGISLSKVVRKNWEIYLFLFPAVAYIFIFCYIPMYGVQIAFKDFRPTLGIWGSEWVGMKHFTRFVTGPFFWQIIRNTLSITLYSMPVGFILSIIFALFLNYQKNLAFKRIVQTVSYAPYFISTVVIVGLFLLLFSPSNGVINIVIKMLGNEPINFMAEPSYFRHIYVWTGIWQGLGFSTIIYIGALNGVSPELHEAAIIDGATIMKRIWHVDLPSISQTIIILLILNTGGFLSVGFEKIYLMQNSLNATVSEVISTYVYKQGLLKSDYSFSSAVGLFNSFINMCVLMSVNFIARKAGDTSLL